MKTALVASSWRAPSSGEPLLPGPSAVNVLLRPGGAVHVVDEGLLFCGWKSSGLVTCKPGVVRVWQAVEPLLREGVDPSELRAQMPDHVMVVLDTLLAELNKHDMLTTAERTSGLSAAQTHLAHFAPDLLAAWSAAEGASIGLIGRAELTEPVNMTLAACGLSTVSPAEPDALLAFLGDRVSFVAAKDLPIRVAAVSCGRRILIADCVTGQDRLLLAVDTLDTAELAELTPTPVAWLIARTLLVERIHRGLAGLGDETSASIIEGATAKRVLLPAPPRAARPMAWSEMQSTTPAPSTAQTAAVESTPELGLLLDGPHPGQLAQIPLARQQVRLYGMIHNGVGLDQKRAGEDALLTATRAHVRRMSGGTGGKARWHLAPFPVAGRGGADLLAEAVGRVLVDLAAPLTIPVNQQSLADARAIRWHQAVQWSTGAPARLRVGPSQHCPGIVLASATMDLHTTWGYGSNQDQALEHALRGLLKRTLVRDGTELTDHRVAVAHEAAAGESVLCHVLGQAHVPVISTQVVDDLTGRIPGFHCQLWDLGDEFQRAGVLGAMVGVRE